MKNQRHNPEFFELVKIAAGVWVWYFECTWLGKEGRIKLR